MESGGLINTHNTTQLPWKTEDWATDITLHS